MILGMRKTLPGLDNFYLAGQWVEPGGSVPVVAMSGRNAVRLICHNVPILLLRPFVASSFISQHVEARSVADLEAW